MNIALIGAGNVGAALAQSITRVGHHVTVSSSRLPMRSAWRRSQARAPLPPTQKR